VSGKLIIITAPSGSGKTSIVRYLLEQEPSLGFSVSATTRPMRSGEVDGKDYYFLTPERFKERQEAGDFLEWEEVYPGLFYGTLELEVRRRLNAGQHVIFDIDVKGAVNLKKHFPDSSLALFIRPPSAEVLADRLRSRGTEDEEMLEKRIGKAQEELAFESEFDRTVVNDVLVTAQEEALQLVRSFIGVA
jgi:guanylate kinase